MQIKGRRLHIAGSINNLTSFERVKYAQELVKALVVSLASEGASFHVNLGREPCLNNETAGLPLIFDWTVADAAHEAIKNGVAVCGPHGKLLSVISRQGLSERIPPNRQGLWKELSEAFAVDLMFMRSGWASAALRRIRSAEKADILIVLGGGEGVEHLAQEFLAHKKPVIPLDLDVGSYQKDGSGGAMRILGEVLAKPEAFLDVGPKEATGALLSNLTTRQGARPITEVITAIKSLILQLTRPKVFYVRLLNRKLNEFNAVERFFREAVDKVIDAQGYQKVEMGATKNDYALMNEQIFAGLHFCEAAVVDLTGLRENCFTELGYALGRAKPIMLTAQSGTSFPFDVSPLEAYMWSDTDPNPLRIQELTAYWQRNVGKPAIVKPIGLI